MTVTSTENPTENPTENLAATLTADGARAIAETVTDPELPFLTLADLGVLRSVELATDDCVTVVITPTYSGCPALHTMREDVRRALLRAGFPAVEVRTALSPAWSTDWITPAGKAKLAAAGISPPGPAPRQGAGPVPLTLGRTLPAIGCPQCGSLDTVELSRFSATACKSLHRCRSCAEPFEHVKEI